MGERPCAYVDRTPGATLTLEALARFLGGRRIARFQLLWEDIARQRATQG
jgi:hypothetical protein